MPILRLPCRVWVGLDTWRIIPRWAVCRSQFKVKPASPPPDSMTIMRRATTPSMNYARVSSREATSCFSWKNPGFQFLILCPIHFTICLKWILIGQPFVITINLMQTFEQQCSWVTEHRFWVRHPGILNHLSHFVATLTLCKLLVFSH